jgi:hypothetical protein
MCDTSPNSLRNPNVGPKVKQWKKKRIETCFLTYNISKIGRHVEILG